MNINDIIKEAESNYRQSELAKRIDAVEVFAINHGFDQWHGQTIPQLFTEQIKLAVESALEGTKLEKSSHKSKNINPSHEKDELYCCLDCAFDSEYNSAVAEQAKKISNFLGKELNDL